MIEVVPYSIDQLKRLLIASSGASPFVIQTKTQTAYFKDYFQAVGAKTILVEQPYTDRDFLEDFAGYYVRCFHDYRRTCARLHFFTCDFTHDKFCECLSAQSTAVTCEQLQEAYLGFIVVKPLPETVIGRTCLKTYPDDNKRRHFPSTRTYAANLFGIPLQTESLAFQEQDTVAAACATSALWTVFQGTGKLFQHRIPSPIEITKTASTHWMTETRDLPNSGLTADQMAFVIRSLELEPFVVNAKEMHILRATIYAYLRGHIPPLLGMSLHDFTSGHPSFRNRGRHAVAVTGFSMGLTNVSGIAPSGLLLRSSRMDKIYVHDDQVGPFSRMELRADHLTTSWPDTAGNIGNVRAIPELLLIPLYHKIRIPLKAVLDILADFDSFIEELRKYETTLLPARIEWDVFLTGVNDFRAEIRLAPELNVACRCALAQRSLPKYLWRATALSNGQKVADLIFDATDIEQADLAAMAVPYDKVFADVMKNLSTNAALSTFLPDHRVRSIVSSFAK